MDIAAWLHSLGMQQYDQAFRDNAIDAAILPELTANDLRELGVTLVGPNSRVGEFTEFTIRLPRAQ